MKEQSGQTPARESKRLKLLLVGLLLVAVAAATALGILGFFRSDEQKVRHRVQTFAAAYFRGDESAVADCLAANLRDQASEFIPAEAVQSPELEILSVAFSSDTDATVCASLTCAGETTPATVTFRLVQERFDWYIAEKPN